MALSVSYCLGSQVSIPGIDRSDQRKLSEQHSCNLWFFQVRSGGIERAAGSRASCPPKLAVSTLMGRLKGQTAMRVFRQFRNLRKHRYWGNHFWAKGYCVDTVGLDAEMIRKYVRYQEKKEQLTEQLQLID